MKVLKIVVLCFLSVFSVRVSAEQIPYQEYPISRIIDDSKVHRFDSENSILFMKPGAVGQHIIFSCYRDAANKVNYKPYIIWMVDNEVFTEGVIPKTSQFEINVCINVSGNYKDIEKINFGTITFSGEQNSVMAFHKAFTDFLLDTALGGDN